MRTVMLRPAARRAAAVAGRHQGPAAARAAAPAGPGCRPYSPEVVAAVLPTVRVKQMRRLLCVHASCQALPTLVLPRPSNQPPTADSIATAPPLVGERLAALETNYKHVSIHMDKMEVGATPVNTPPFSLPVCSP